VAVRDDIQRLTHVKSVNPNDSGEFKASSDA
jgi:hypothetical protein